MATSAPSSTLSSSKVAPTSASPIRIYSTAALFNSRELAHNIQLNQVLEEKFGYKIFVPQRDGFEYAQTAQLFSHFKDSLNSDEEANLAIQRVIYLLDMGHFIGQSEVTVACLDEPVDEGCVVEIAQARALGKIVIGWRSDERTPFGSAKDPFRGLNFFPAFQCDVVLTHRSSHLVKAEQVKADLELLATAIHKSIEEETKRRKEITSIESLSKFATLKPSPQALNLVKVASRLFDGIADLHTPESLRLVVSRYASLLEDVGFEYFRVSDTSAFACKE